MHPNRLCAALAAVLWTLAVVIEVATAVHTHDTWGSAAVILAIAACLPTGYMGVCAVVDRSRAMLLDTLLEALERTEQEVVQSITPRR